MAMSRGNAIGISTPSWIPTIPFEEMSKTEYNVLIVGTGAGGSAALQRLCRRIGKRGMKNGVIERGDLIFPTHGLNVPTFVELGVDATVFLEPSRF